MKGIKNKVHHIHKWFKFMYCIYLLLLVLTHRRATNGSTIDIKYNGSFAFSEQKQFGTDIMCRLRVVASALAAQRRQLVTHAVDTVFLWKSTPTIAPLFNTNTKLLIYFLTSSIFPTKSLATCANYTEKPTFSHLIYLGKVKHQMKF